MFKDMMQMAGLMRQLPKIKEEMERLQQRIGEVTAEGDAGGGMVKVKVNGRNEVIAVTIGDDALSDRELLEDLIRSAVNQAIDKAKQRVAEETGKMTSELGLPAGLGLPGLPG